MKINQTGAVMFLLSSVATLRSSLAFAPPKNSLVKRTYHASLSVLRAENEGKQFKSTSSPLKKYFYTVFISSHTIL